MDYHSYIRSDRWRRNHSKWLKVANHRCSMFPWVRVGKVAGRYHKYEMHHMTYENLGDEHYLIDVIALCPFAHDFIIHGILSGFRSPKEQKRYPNPPQRVLHCWCRLPAIAKLILICAIAISQLII